MDDTKYNGWTNYATWLINIEVFDGLDIREYFGERPTEQEAARWVENYLDDLVDNCVSPAQPGAELILGWAKAFLRDVDFREIAAHLLQDVEFPEQDFDDAIPE
jgi:hypothetical protein